MDYTNGCFTVSMKDNLRPISAFVPVNLAKTEYTAHFLANFEI